jgi:hypothetical protein
MRKQTRMLKRISFIFAVIAIVASGCKSENEGNMPLLKPGMPIDSQHMMGWLRK